MSLLKGSSAFFLLWIVSTSLCGQGLILDDSLYNSLPRQPQLKVGHKSENKLLRENPKIDLRPFCPTPQSQGAIGSCTGWSSGYGAMTILHAIRNNWRGLQDSINGHAFSALFIYNQVKINSCHAGAHIYRAGDLLKEKGDVLSKGFDRFKNNCEKRPSEAELEWAKQHRIKDYITLFSSDDPDRVRVEKTKLSLIDNKPVIIGMLLKKNFQNLKSSDTYWYPELGDTTFFGAHAMVVVGYDDSKGAFEIMNSWGNRWGNGGFIWVKYEDYAKFCCYGFQFIPFENPALVKEFKAKAKFIHPQYDDQDQLVFKEETLILKNQQYELARGAVPKGYLFQVKVPHVTPGNYLYLFSFDARKNIRVHWPRDGKLDAKFDGVNESAIISVPNIDITIPDTLGALTLEKPGYEYICALISKEPIVDLNKKLERVKASRSADFRRKLLYAFSHDLEPIDGILYESKGEAGFSQPMQSGKVVPIIFRLRVK